MQPHYNLGIRFRTHFDSFGISKKRIASKLQKEMNEHFIALKEERISWPLIRNTIKELSKTIKRLQS